MYMHSGHAGQENRLKAASRVDESDSDEPGPPGVVPTWPQLPSPLVLNAVAKHRYVDLEFRPAPLMMAGTVKCLYDFPANLILQVRSSTHLGEDNHASIVS